ncbi:DUF6701 domain-containing protein [Vibrio echinoideorum]|uniref:DUF6701 domain-containing protein n=1 Tax=Vibrio echinoideorum TaxID=2100116 RepID=UPI00354CD4DB
MSMFRKLVGVLILFLFSVSAHAELFPSGICPSASVQTWNDSGGEVEFKENSYVRNSAGVGFSSIKMNHDESCGRNACSADSSKILTQSPNFTIPNSATDIESLPGVPNFVSGNKIKLEDWQSIVLPSGTYFTSKEIELKDDSSLRVSGDVILYVDKFKMKDDSFISYNRGNSGNEFFLVGTDKSHIKIETDNSVYAHIVSDDHVDLEEDVYFTGTITGKKVHLKENSILNTQLPANCDHESPVYSNDAQYEFGVASCIGGECQIDFKKEYEITPLVFVMPTADESELDSDAPASLYVESTSKLNATIRQVRALSRDDSNRLWQSQPMTEVSYFVMEPGTQTIAGHRIVAGYTSTKAEAAKFSGNSSVSVNFSSFGFSQFTHRPVVLHQLQSKINANWMTSGQLRPTRSGVRIFIELGASSNTVQQEETIAFLAAEPTNQPLVDGMYQFEFGTNTSVSQGEFTSFYDGCRRLKTTGLSSIDGILLNKQERAGQHGGWLRRCQLNNNQYSVVMDEDHTRRGHIVEDIGYFAFAKNIELPPVCDVTPFAVQSWDHSSELTWTSKTTGIQINGTYNRSRAVGIRLDPSNPNNPTDPNSFKQCDGGECVESDNLYVSSPDVISVDWPVNQNFQPGSGQHQLSDNQAYNTVTSSGGGTITLTDGSYRIEHLEIIAGSRMNLTQDTEIVVNTFTLTDSSTFNTNGYSLRIWAENNGASKASVSVADNLNADVFSRDSVTVSSGQGVINGRVTAFDVTLSPDGKIINNDLSCPVETSDYEVVLSPEIDIALTCEAITATAKVYNNKVIDTSFNGTVTLSSNGNTLDTAMAQSGVATFSVDSNVVQTIDAMASITITGQDYESNAVNYQFVPERFEILPTPLNLIAGRSQAIAISPLECNTGGTPISDTSYLGDSEVSLSNVSYIYPSTPLNSASIEILDKDGDWVSSPSAGVTPLELTFVSENGKVVANSEIKYAESGQATFTLSDKQCISDEDGVEKCKEYTGTKEVKSRPWTFAVCPPPSINGTDGDSTGGFGFMPARESFSLNVKPVVWSAALDVNVDSNVNGQTGPLRLFQKRSNSPFCSLATTENFYVDDSATNTSVELVHSLATPSNGIAGVMSGGDAIDNHSTTTELEFTNLSVTEVGSFHFQAQSNNTFYDAIEGGIDPGARELGRFYPRYFQVVGENWYYFGNQNFNYMNQNFDEVSFDVEALSGGTSPQAVENYQHFDSDVQARFNLYDNVMPNRLRFPDFGHATWAGTEQSIGTFSATPTGHCSDGNANSLCWSKADTAMGYEDGPFNDGSGSESTDIRIALESSTDPIEFWDNGDQLDSQPVLRFGRVALDSVGGTVNSTLTIPLRVEFWNGERFITSDLGSDGDSTTEVQSVNDSSGNVDIWVEENQTADTLTFSGSGTVVDGELNNITVTHSTQVRQQTQMWLELDSGANDMSWLRYNWASPQATSDRNGEQDPSTVVTFGIYRGNDRVIYRGESGLTGQ